MIVEVREFWLLLGAASFFASACLVLSVVLAVMIGD
jgi:hypothetical protein